MVIPPFPADTPWRLPFPFFLTIPACEPTATFLRVRAYYPFSNFFDSPVIAGKCSTLSFLDFFYIFIYPYLFSSRQSQGQFLLI